MKMLVKLKCFSGTIFWEHGSIKFCGCLGIGDEFWNLVREEHNWWHSYNKKQLIGITNWFGSKTKGDVRLCCCFSIP